MLFIVSHPVWYSKKNVAKICWQDHFKFKYHHYPPTWTQPAWTQPTWTMPTRTLPTETPPAQTSYNFLYFRCTAVITILHRSIISIIQPGRNRHRHRRRGFHRLGRWLLRRRACRPYYWILWWLPYWLTCWHLCWRCWHFCWLLAWYKVAS